MRIRRHPMIALALVALGAWVTLGLFGKFVSPTSALARAVFLLLLFFALSAALAPVTRLAAFWLVGSKWYHLHGVRQAVRQMRHGGQFGLRIHHWTMMIADAFDDVLRQIPRAQQCTTNFRVVGSQHDLFRFPS